MLTRALSSPRQTFVIAPLAVVLAQAVRGRRPLIDARGLALCATGHALYRAAGAYRVAQGAGSSGFARPPDRLVTTGPYSWSRNPMYLGHLVFLAGLALATRSPVAVAALAYQAARLGRRVRTDEERLERIFGDEYRDYAERVPRWI